MNKSAKAECLVFLLVLALPGGISLFCGCRNRGEPPLETDRQGRTGGMQAAPSASSPLVRAGSRSPQAVSVPRCMPSDCESSCARGSQPHCVALGIRILQSPPADTGKAFKLFDQACAAGNPVGCGAMAGMYLSGAGVGREVGKALDLYKDACDRGDALSCESLGGFHLGIDGHAPTDVVKAHRYYARGCELGSPSCCVWVGAGYSDGILGFKDPASAAQMYEFGCNGGQAPGCKALADAYNAGEGVDRDPARAHALYGRACSLGLQKACGL